MRPGERSGFFEGRRKRFCEAALACLFSDDRPSAIQDTANFLVPSYRAAWVLRKMGEGIAGAGNDPAWQTTASGLVRVGPVASPLRRMTNPERMASPRSSDRTVEDGVCRSSWIRRPRRQA